MVFDLIKFQHLSYLTVDKWSTIVIYDPMRYPKFGNYFFLDKVCHNISYDFTEWYGLYPFGELFHNHEDPHVPMRRWINWSH